MQKCTKIIILVHGSLWNSLIQVVPSKSGMHRYADLVDGYPNDVPLCLSWHRLSTDMLTYYNDLLCRYYCFRNANKIWLNQVPPPLLTLKKKKENVSFYIVVNIIYIVVIII